MSEPTFVKLSEIKPNPYQPRTAEDGAAIAEIAVNIFRNGLLQIPSARRVNGHYELVFGHTRKAAYDLLATQGVPSADIAPDKRFSQMPLYIHDLDDRQMFEMAVAENIKRRDLNPIEQATAMQRYMNEFDANSKQAAELFGMSDATVRGVVRLLDLPKQVQDKVASGEISQSAARMMLVLSRMAPHRIDYAIDEILDGEHPENLVDDILRTEKTVNVIREEHFPIGAKAFKHLPDLSEKALPVDEEKRAQLLNPTACTACPFYAKVGGSNYCSFSQCFDRKCESQTITNLEAASKKTGIAIYSKEADGAFSVLDRWEDSHRKAVGKKDSDLRLMKAGNLNSYWHYIHQDIPMNVALVAVGKLGEKIKKAKVKSEIERGRIPQEADPKEKAKVIKEQVNQQVVRNEYDRIMFETIAPFFLPMIESVTSEGLLQLLADSLGVENDLFDLQNETNLKGKARIKHLHLGIICELWEREDGSYDVRIRSRSAKMPVSELAKGIRKHTEKWGVKLGKGFDQAAAEADIQINELRRAAIEDALKDIVSAETEGKKK